MARCEILLVSLHMQRAAQERPKVRFCLVLEGGRANGRRRVGGRKVGGDSMRRSRGGGTAGGAIVRLALATQPPVDHTILIPSERKGEKGHREAQAALLRARGRLHVFVLVALRDAHHGQHQALEQVGALQVAVVVDEDVHQQLAVVADGLQAADDHALVAHVDGGGRPAGACRSESQVASRDCAPGNIGESQLGAFERVYHQIRHVEFPEKGLSEI